MPLAHFAQRAARSVVQLCSSLVALSACLAGCAGPVPEQEEGVVSTSEAVEGVNGLAMNGLAMNGLVKNGLAMNGLTANGLTANGLMRTSAISAALNGDPLAQMFMQYVVSCALPTGQNVVLTTPAGQPSYTFTGGLGVAPEWGAGDRASCDATCQQWVSACVISRVNALGQHVALSERGNNPALALVAGEAAFYPNREATYFGNVFLAPQELYGCRSAGDDQTLIGRVCGDGADVSGCLVTVADPCQSRCGPRRADGSYAECATANGSFMPAVTVYRLSTSTSANM